MWPLFRLSCAVLLALCQAPFPTHASLRGAEPLFDFKSTRDDVGINKRSFPDPRKALQVFEVSPPLLGPNGALVGAGRLNPFPDKFLMDPAVTTSTELCNVKLVDYVFADSFEAPALVDYNPPACLAGANTAIANLTVQSIGRQLDRPSSIFLGDVEILRWSTAEPRQSGVVWTAMKDVSQFMALWRLPQKVIFDLGNYVFNLNGTYNVTWDVTFFKAPARATLQPAGVIIPISSKEFTHNRGNPQPSLFYTLDTNETWVIVDNFPRNVLRAVVTIQADAQLDEEFWYSNFPSSTAEAFTNTTGPNGGLTGYREIRLYIDDLLAGYFPPFPMIYSGGINPAFWQPIVGIDLFDQKETEIDISPFLPLLCDGKTHNFTIRVFGLSDDGVKKETGQFSPYLTRGPGTYWRLTGNIYVWEGDKAGFVTTGSKPVIEDSEPEISIKQALKVGQRGMNDALDYSVHVKRSFSIDGTVITENGWKRFVKLQSILHHHEGSIKAQGNITSLSHQTNYSLRMGSSDSIEYQTEESYPLTLETKVHVLRNGTVQKDANLNRGKRVERAVIGPGSTSNVFPSGLQLFAAIKDTAVAIAKLDCTLWQTFQQVSGRQLVFPGDPLQRWNYADAVHSQNATFSGMTERRPDTEFYSRDVFATSAGLLSSEERVAGKVVATGRPGSIFP